MQGRVQTTAASLAALEIWLVACACVAGMIWPAALPVALALVGCFWLARWVAFGRLSVRTAGDWAIGLLVLMILVTGWTTVLPEVTRPQVYRLLIGIAAYYAIANWTNSLARLRTLAVGLTATGLLLALSSAVGVKWIAGEKLTFIPEAVYQRLPLLLADPIHPNIMAGVLVVLLPFALGPLLFAWRQLHQAERVLGVLAAASMLVVVVLTKSRGGLLALAATLVLLAVLRWRHGWLAALLALATGVLALGRLGAGQVVKALTETQTLGGLAGRLEVWSRALSMIQDFPFTGIGMGTFKQVANILYPFFLAGPDADVPHAHNLYLQVAVDLGLPGLVAWLALFGLVCAAAWRVYRQGQSGRLPYLAGLGAGLLCAQVALAVHGLLDAPTWGTRPAVVVWALWGAAMVAYSLSLRAAKRDGSATSA